VTRREQYVCLIERDDDGRVTSLVVDAVDLEGAEHRVRINGSTAARVAGAVHDVLRAAGVTGRTWTSQRPIALDQVTGAQVKLLLQAVKPLRRGDRVERVGEGIAGMSREEASYWHAKSTRPGGLRALRVLLTKGGMR
jgi:hypothetical protein